MSQFWEFIKIALMNIRSNKGRSVLTMLGIIIGISSVIMIISIGNGVKSEITGELNNMAGGQIYIYSRSNDNGESVEFNEEDFQMLRERVGHIKAITPNYGFQGAVTAKKGTFTGIVSGGTEAVGIFQQRSGCQREIFYGGRLFFRPKSMRRYPVRRNEDVRDYGRRRYGDRGVHLWNITGLYHSGNPSGQRLIHADYGICG